MSWTKLIGMNLLVGLLLVSFVEFGAAVTRTVIGKSALIPFVKTFNSPDYRLSSSHPCIEMKTDVLLSHIPNHRGKCEPRGGKVHGEYVYYREITSKNPKILVLGGSTSSGFYQHFSDGFTWPLFLQKKFADDVDIINGAVGGYSSTQELYKFIKDGPRINKLSLVISLSGINELSDYQGEPEARSNAHPFLSGVQFAMNNSQRWIDQRTGSNIFFKALPNLASAAAFLVKDRKRLNLEVKGHQKIASMKALPSDERWE